MPSRARLLADRAGSATPPAERLHASFAVADIADIEPAFGRPEAGLAAHKADRR